MAEQSEPVELHVTRVATGPQAGGVKLVVSRMMIPTETAGCGQ